MVGPYMNILVVENLMQDVSKFSVDCRHDSLISEMKYKSAYSFVYRKYKLPPNDCK